MSPIHVDIWSITKKYKLNVSMFTDTCHIRPITNKLHHISAISTLIRSTLNIYNSYLPISGCPQRDIPHMPISGQCQCQSNIVHIFQHIAHIKEITHQLLHRYLPIYGSYQRYLIHICPYKAHIKAISPIPVHILLIFTNDSPYIANI